MNQKNSQSQDDLLLDKFFARQKAEIVQRVQHQRRQQRDRYGLLALAASVLLALGFSWAVLNQGAQAPAGASSFVLNLPTDAIETVDDPLAPFGAWDTNGAANQSLDVPLPPLGEIDPPANGLS